MYGTVAIKSLLTLLCCFMPFPERFSVAKIFFLDLVTTLLFSGRNVFFSRHNNFFLATIKISGLKKWQEKQLFRNHINKKNA